MSDSRPYTGFTLVEVMVALVIGGMAVAGAGALLGALGDRAESIKLAASRADTGANGERLLQELAGNFDFGNDTLASLRGNADSLAFHTWCETAAGWLERCAARLSFDHREGVAALDLALHRAAATVLTVRHDFDRGGFRYLDKTDHRLHWAESWSRHEPPVAIGIVIDADTLLLPVRRDD